jgi:hypothetical protein
LHRQGFADTGARTYDRVVRDRIVVVVVGLAGCGRAGFEAAEGVRPDAAAPDASVPVRRPLSTHPARGTIHVLDRASQPLGGVQIAWSAVRPLEPPP